MYIQGFFVILVFSDINVALQHAVASKAHQYEIISGAIIEKGVTKQELHNALTKLNCEGSVAEELMKQKSIASGKIFV